MKTAREFCRGIFGDPLPPKHVWEREFDYNDAALQELSKKDWKRIDAGDLTRSYILNLVYVEPLQPELFQYLFPICLASWSESLMDSVEPAWGDDFYRALKRPYLFESMMTTAQGEAVKAFIIESMLARFDRERGFIYEASRTPAYAWLRALNDLGGSVPILEKLWTRWWEIDSPGKAVSALMYVSGLIYTEGENPIFDRWTPERGGGGPYLSEMWLDGCLPQNKEFLHNYLTLDRVLKIASSAAENLTHEPEAALARRISTDAQTRKEIIEIQIDDLIRAL